MSTLNKRGFSVLEAVLALAVLTIALTPLLLIHAQTNRELQKAEQTLARVSAQRSALALLDAINPMETPRGSMMVSNTLRFNWTSSRVSEVEPARLSDGLPGRFEVAVFRVTGEIIGTGSTSASVDIHQLGWRERNR